MLPVVLLLASASATTLAGDLVSIDYNSGGTWNDATLGTGFRLLIDDVWVDFSYAGMAYQTWAIAYEVEGESVDAWANSALGNQVIVNSITDVSANGQLALEAVYQTGELTVTKVEWFDAEGSAVGVSFALTNNSVFEVENLRVLYAVDADPDATAYSDYTTLNDVLDVDDDGVDDWAQAPGASTGAGLGFLACEPDLSTLGFWSEWSTSTDADPLLTDPAGAASDSAMGLRWSAENALPAGGSIAFRFVVGAGAAPEGALDSALALAATACCDGDGDGADALACGGADCDDVNPSVNASATDIPYDGIDQDCSGADVYDVDGDGESAIAAGGRDCDDNNARVFTAAAEIWYDGIDENCDGNDDDQDLDGYVLAYDCDDEDPSIHEDCPELDTDGNDPIRADGSCGCRAGGPGAGAAAVAFVLALVGRRRREPRDIP